MTVANVHQAKTNLSKLLDAAERGEEVIITRRGGGVTEFRLVPVAPSARRALFGRLAGQVVFSPDYDTADAEITAAFDRHLDS
jgi:prevent-host-death family protein